MAVTSTRCGSSPATRGDEGELGRRRCRPAAAAAASRLRSRRSRPRTGAARGRRRRMPRSGPSPAPRPWPGRAASGCRRCRWRGPPSAGRFDQRRARPVDPRLAEADAGAGVAGPRLGRDVAALPARPRRGRRRPTPSARLRLRGSGSAPIASTRRRRRASSVRRRSGRRAPAPRSRCRRRREVDRERGPAVDGPDRGPRAPEAVAGLVPPADLLDHAGGEAVPLRRREPRRGGPRSGRPSASRRTAARRPIPTSPAPRGRRRGTAAAGPQGACRRSIPARTGRRSRSTRRRSPPQPALDHRVLPRPRRVGRRQQQQARPPAPPPSPRSAPHRRRVPAVALLARPSHGRPKAPARRLLSPPRAAPCPGPRFARMRAMPLPTKDQVTEKLRAVIDPELRRSIVELGMVRSIDIQDERPGRGDRLADHRRLPDPLPLRTGRRPARSPSSKA